ncbi:copper amine oxidase N-terminal domain-containing protein [Brevibacillus porteri]|uniref:copper amine oxidase N-terminal domain-containing protein n=1 Tax=Brevibacillus porteri TaxID=2126350 RepID=UPI003D19A1A5
MVKMVRLFTCLALTFFIFFASVPVSYASLEKNPLLFEFTEVKFVTKPDGSHYAQGYLNWGNLSPYEIIELKGSIDLLNKQGQKISTKPKYIERYNLEAGTGGYDFFEMVDFDLVPSVTNPSQIEGAYLKQTYTFTLGKKAELRPYIVPGAITFWPSGDNLTIKTILTNHGEATASNFKYAGISLTDQNGMVHFYSQTSHAVINSSLRLEPGQFARVSFQIPMNFINSKFSSVQDIFTINFSFTHENSAPYKDTALGVTVNNKKLNDLILVENDVTYVPLRDLADALGATLQWDDSTQSATITQETYPGSAIWITIPAGSNRFIINNYPVTTSAKAKLHNNTILVVPLREVAEMLNCEVNFDHKWGQKSIIVIPHDYSEE